jgi:hypothetical protein
MSRAALAVEPTTTDRLLQQLIDELRQLRAVVERRSQASRLARADRDRLARILSAVAAAIGSELFLSGELMEHGSPGLRIVLAGLNTKQLGRLLRRAAGVPVDGFVVERMGVEMHAALWRIVKEFPDPSKPHGLPHGAPRSGVMGAE